jgi:predicted kinase
LSHALVLPPDAIDAVRPLDLVLIAGVQGSGKTTFALEHFRQRIRVNLDEIRRFYRRMTAGAEWTSQDWNPGIEPLFRQIEEQVIRHNLGEGMHVVVDNTNISRRSRAHYLGLAHELGRTVGVIFLDLPLDVCLRHNGQRSARVPDPVLREFHSGREMPARDEGFDYLRVVGLDELGAPSAPPPASASRDGAEGGGEPCGRARPVATRD